MSVLYVPCSLDLGVPESPRRKAGKGAGVGGEGCGVEARVGPEGGRAPARDTREHLHRFLGLLPGRHGQNVALTVLHVPGSLESGLSLSGWAHQFEFLNHQRAKQEKAREWAVKDEGLRLAWDRREAEHLHVRRGNTFTGF